MDRSCSLRGFYLFIYLYIGVDHLFMYDIDVRSSTHDLCRHRSTIIKNPLRVLKTTCNMYSVSAGSIDAFLYIFKSSSPDV